MGWMLPFGDIPAELYRWLLFAYGITAVGRVSIEAYKQITILNTAWYDVVTPAFSVLELGFVQHALLSLALAEVSNMVLGALMKRKARTEGRAEGHAKGRAEGHAEGRAEARAETNKKWREWLQRKEEADSKGEPFNEPAPDAVAN